MKITNWFLKGLTKYGRTEKFPKAESKNVFEVNKVLKPLKFRPFKRSFYIYPVDSGTCGACNMELQAISTPHYDMNRLGLFMTNTPRHADALLIMGVYSERMVDILERAYNAMPEPKLVVTLGDCAVTGGIIGKCPQLSENAVINIPGCPPDPYAILEGIVKARDVSSE